MFDGEGAPRLGRLHQRRAERRPAGPLVARVRHRGRRHRLRPLLEQQRPRATCRASTTRCGATWRRPSGATPGSSATTPSTSRSPRRSSASATSTSTPSSSASTRGRSTSAPRSHGAPALRCPRRRPGQRRRADHPGQRPHASHLRRAGQLRHAAATPTYLGPMDLRNLVYNVHLYCGARSPVTGNPTNVCAVRRRRTTHSLGVRSADRPEMASRAQPGGPAWLVTEFGATSSVAAPGDDHRRSWTPSRSAGSTGPGSTTATPRGARPSRWSWPTGVCGRPPAC